jgi:glycosyltransferase involved in cell wall biosynthesis
LTSHTNTDPLIIIPAFNVAHVLQEVLAKLPPERCIVIDDGSTDGTSEVASANGFVVLRHPDNLGLSAAVCTGVAYARERGYAKVLLMDADGQHPPELYPEFFSAMSENEFVLGDRFSSIRDVPFSKVSSNLFASLMIKQVTGVFVRDTSCGYRGFRISENDRFDRCSGYSFIYSQLIRYLSCGIFPARVRVPAIYDHTRPLATRYEEVIALHDALASVAADDRQVCQLGEYLATRRDIRMTLDGCRFTGRYAEATGAYQFEADIGLAQEFYENNGNQKYRDYSGRKSQMGSPGGPAPL